MFRAAFRRLGPAAGLLAAGLLATGAAAPAAPPSVPREVTHVPVRPVTGLPPGWTQAPPQPRGCVDAGRIGGAVLLGGRTIELSLRGGQRARLRFAAECPQLAYYGGFYYKPGRDGRLCAGRDRVIGREGTGCRIAALIPLRPAPRPARRR